MSQSPATPILLTNLTHLRFQGPDAERYLNGQVTQQVEGLPLGQSRYTFVCDAKGRVLFDATVRRDEAGYLLSIMDGQAEDHLARMDRYLIADDCELSDESDRWVIRHELCDESHKNFAINRFGYAGHDHYLEGQAKEAVLPETPSRDEQENLRLLHGVARLADLVGALPAETGLEHAAVSFHKGCYLGQEVVSRMKRAGQTNRKLIAIFLDGPCTDLPLQFTECGASKTLLEVTSVSTSSTAEGYPALGYLSRRADDLSLLESLAGLKASLRD